MPVVATAEGGLVTARSAGQADVVAETDGVAGMVTVYVGSHSPGGDFREVGVGLIEQDRELAAIMTGGPEGRSSFWGPQLHEGLLYPSDIPHGVRVFEFTRR
ncbi:MAG: hypothetical protein GWM92_10255 [Gemmatimonadetes bacterium]|nr:hypothetical protein [Gemmatimonadota bacterium]NIR79046.1 hypothetical protein [Gemmatimonadota bacterium]NIT87703.1 hypothetical protein [Gemmatimonadota bacterium]NIU31564.1 hypothetical protein [Gemmatimonadota bacterium]NIU36220.1 hypothetical protein [Gemmatimonadota bacterium]